MLTAWSIFTNKCNILRGREKKTKTPSMCLLLRTHKNCCVFNRRRIELQNSSINLQITTESFSVCIPNNRQYSSMIFFLKLVLHDVILPSKRLAASWRRSLKRIWQAIVQVTGNYSADSKGRGKKTQQKH